MLQNRRFLTRVGIFAAAVGLSATLSMAVVSPIAAQGRGGAGGRGGMNPEMMAVMQSFGMIRAMADPMQSQLLILVNRDDVRRELLIDGRQREKLATQQEGYGAGIGAAMQSAFQKARAAGGQGTANWQNMTPEERTAARQQMQDTRQTAMNEFQDGQNKQIAAILRPDQIKRLAQLDLQWRGALALADPTLAQQVKLTPDQKVQITALTQALKTEQGGSRRAAFGGGRNRGGNAAPVDPNAAPPARPTTPEELTTVLTPVAVSLEKLRVANNTKAVALLTPEQMKVWNSLTGKPFRFRVQQ